MLAKCTNIEIRDSYSICENYAGISCDSDVQLKNKNEGDLGLK